MQAEELIIGCQVLIDGVPRVVQAITKKKVGYHIGQNESRMHYERLRDIKPIPLNSSICSIYNEQTSAFMCWDDTCEECSHQYVAYKDGAEFYMRYLHELQLFAKLIKVQFVI